MENKKFKFVYIPADSSQPLQELEQEITPGQEVEALTHRLQKHFRDASASKRLSRDTQRAALKEHVGGSAAGLEITDDMLDRIGEMQLVETVSLLPGLPENGFQHINMYVDDSGMIKSLPINERASGITATAGHPCTIHGDAFVARTIDSDNTEFSRPDFLLSELDSGAAWVADALKASRRRMENAGRSADLLKGSGVQTVDVQKSERDEQERDLQQKSVDGQLYTWSQAGDEVAIDLPVPPETKAKDVKCVIKAQAIELSVATLPEGQRQVLNGTLFQMVAADESNWTIANVDGGRFVQVVLTKKQNMRWLGVLR